jgi:hypothetical protein
MLISKFIVYKVIYLFNYIYIKFIEFFRLIVHILRVLFIKPLISDLVTLTYPTRKIVIKTIKNNTYIQTFISGCNLNTIPLYNQENYEMNDCFMNLIISKEIVKNCNKYSVEYPYKIVFT